MNPPNIGLCGKIASGKTTVADILVERYGYVKLSFAAPLKELAWVCAEYMNLEKEAEDVDFFSRHVCHAVGYHQLVSAMWQYEQELNNLFFANIKPRKFLQYVGTEIFRAADPDVWVKYLLKSLPTDGTPWCIDDVRFMSEVNGLRSVGAKIVRCSCLEDIRQARMRSLYPEQCGTVDAHSSETELDEYNYVDCLVGCNYTMSELCDEVSSMLSSLGY